MKKKLFIGIDVSAATLDICYTKGTETQSIVIKNQLGEINKWLKQFSKEEVILAMENTGYYNWLLYEALVNYNFKVYVIPPLHLKKSLGLIRGKNDKIDAKRIMQFIIKNHEQLEPWKRPERVIQKLKVLLTERTSRIKMKRQLIGKQRTHSIVKSLKLDKELKSMNQKLLDQLDKQIKKLEVQIQELINLNEKLKKQSTLVQSVPGVGKVLSWTILAKSNGFESIKTGRKMACYSGIAPFEYQSGSSIYRRPRVSIFADKSMKSILHLAAMSAIRLNNDLRKFYLRKVAEGKNKMSVLNAVRNKIILRIYAVIKRQTPYHFDLDLS